jgi:predicted secreted protein
MTQGTSAMIAKPRFSCIKENPGPLVAVIDFTPAREAPITAPRLAISSSIWIKVPATWGSLTDRISEISVAGVIG